MKGVAVLTEYVLTIALSVLVFISIVALAYTFYRQTLESEIRAELRQVALQTSDSIVKLYSAAKFSGASPSNGTSILLSELDLNLPQRVAQRNYKLSLQALPSAIPVVTSILIDGKNISFAREISGAKIVAKTTEDPFIAQDVILPNIDVITQGSFESGGNATLRYYRYNFNGTLLDTVALGPSGILIRITSVG